MQRYVAGVVLGLALLAGCDSGGAEPPLVQGAFAATFTYTTQDGEFSEAWRFTLQENGLGEITGTGEMGVTAVTVNGTHDHPDVTLAFTKVTTGASQGSFTGTATDDGYLLDGTYSFSFFFVEVPVSLQGTP